MTFNARAPFSGDAKLALLASGFLDHTLPKEAWTNDAHWAASVWLLRFRADFELERDLPDAIRTFNVAKGGQNTDTGGYHETITQASIRVIRLFDARGLPAHATANAILASPFGRKDWFFDHWSRDVLMAPAARRAWVPPDLAPLPTVL